MTSTKAKLIITLKADNTVVAEVEDAVLWQKVLSAIHIPSSRPFESGETNNRDFEPNLKDSKGDDNSPLSRMAKRIGISIEELQGAVDPSTDPPYLTLDIGCWEKMKKQLPPRGAGSIASVAIAGTILALWFREAALGNATQAQVLEILRQINVVDKNAGRGIKTASWLQGRSGGTIVLNPAEITKAYNVIKSFCTKKWNKESAE